MKKILLFSLIYFMCQFTSAQLMPQFIGSAVDQGNNCYTVTPDVLDQVGGVFYDNPIDFDNDFTIYFQGDFGTKDADGADGMALVFKTNSNAEIGNSGGGMGYQNISPGLPSLIVEFDTYQNNIPQEGILADPVFDHIAIQRNGDPFHNNTFANLAGPVQASATNPNIEDGNQHDIKVQWIASSQTLSVFFDCNLRLVLPNFDVKTDIFSGDDTVFFGFVSSTGGLSNLHQICFNNITFIDNLNLSDTAICENDSVNVDASIPSGVTYSWSPTTGVSNPNISNPVLSPLTTTTYTVTIEDVCGEQFTEDITVTVETIVTPTFDAVNPICSGDALAALPTTSNNGVTGTWAPALDNTATTTYTFTPDAAFACAETVTLEIVVNPIITPEFDAVDPICEGDPLSPLPTTSNNGVTGVWSPALDNTTNTTYTFTPDAGQCAVSETLTITVNPLVNPTFDPVADICTGDTLNALPTTSNNGITGTWSPALDNTTSTTYTFTPNGPCGNTTTLEIIVEPLIISEFDPIVPLCPGETLTPLPTTSNNGITGTWSPDINNNETTTYTFTPDAGQGCTVEAMLTVEVLDGQIPTFNIQESICEGDTPLILPTVSEEGITGSWSPAFNNLQTTEYTFTPDPNQCAEINTYTVAVLPIEQLSLSISFESTPFDGNQSIIVNVTGGTGDYEYQLDNRPWTTSNIFTQISGCEDHIINVREASGCSNIATEVFRVFDFPKFFTPNGDTDNDFWNIKCLSNQSNSLISIFNRYGKLIKQISPISSGWDGTYNGNPLPSDDYWFKVEYTDENGVLRSFSSHFALKL